MKIRLILGLTLSILSIIGLFVIIVFITGLWERVRTKKVRPTHVSVHVPEAESNSKSSKLSAQPELSEIAKKRLGLIGPFPVGNDIPKPEREIGRVMNAWREAVVIKSIDEITLLSRQIKRYGPEAIPFLRKLALEDEKERVRAFATRVLGEMRKSKLMPFFMDLLQKDTSPFVRENASWSLGKLGNPQAISVLQKVVNEDESERVRKVAEEAINAIENANKNRKGESRE